MVGKIDDKSFCWPYYQLPDVTLHPRLLVTVEINDMMGGNYDSSNNHPFSKAVKKAFRKVGFEVIVCWTTTDKVEVAFREGRD